MHRHDIESARRPWGTWHVLDDGSGYKVKRIEVAPGHRLSYQTHEQRSEHWIVVAGSATCVIEGETLRAEVGEHLDVPLGAAHRICNEGDQLLVIVEVQLGAYTGEDDIARIEDDYDRADA